MFEWFTILVYQPFLNVLVFFYWVLDTMSNHHGDMGIAVVLLTLFIRFLLLPLSIAEHRGEKSRREISTALEEIEKQYATDPVGRDAAKKAVMKTNRGILIAEVCNLTVQVTIAIMLYFIFKHGLTGGDKHLLYPFLKNVQLPQVPYFLGTYDLTKPSLFLNLTQSFLIFVLETLLMYTSPYPTTRAQVVRMQLVLPLVSFFVFLGMPAGKKVFIITTLCFSIVLAIVRAVQRWFSDYKYKKEAQAAAGEQVVVDVH